MFAASGRAQEPAPAAQLPPERHVDPGEEVSVGGAIEAAMRALERLDTATDDASRSAVLDEIHNYLAVLETQDPDNPWRSFILARSSIALGRPGDAIDKLQQFVQTREGRNEWRAYRMLGDLLVTDFPRLAKSNYEKAMELQPSEPAVLFGLSVALSKIGQRDRALELARRAVDADGRKTVRYLASLAGLLAQEQRWSEAMDTARSAIELAQQDAFAKPARRAALQTLDAQYGLMSEIIRRRIADAVSAADRAPTAAAELGDVYLRLADILDRRGELAAVMAKQEALRAIESGVRQLEPNPPLALLEPYGVRLAESGRTDDALEVFLRIRSADPTNQTASEWLDRLAPDTPVGASQPAHPELRTELLDMQDRDQRLRTEWIDAKGPAEQALGQRVMQLDAEQTARLREMVDEHGWPARSMVGEDGAGAAWLIVQHASADVAFQRRCLDLMEPLVEQGEVSAVDVAYLTDRVRMLEGRPQLYGTQFNNVDGKLELHPIEDAEHVDERRAMLGLEPLAEYKAQLLRFYGKSEADQPDP
jgi:tetratricopeptide (TPR) repeat protein